ncbi:MAG TPA: tape measure protein [Candidatus Competibacter sp.]|nr:tape measure protein [Candidatus Competibacter sp.]
MAGIREVVVRLLLTAHDAASGALSRVRDGAAGIGQAVGQTLAALRSFYALLIAIAGIGTGRELQDRADAYTRLTNSLRIATDSEEAFRLALETVTDIASRTNSDLETTAKLYARVSIAGQSLGIEQKQTARLTELIAKGMQLGNASAQEYASATLQLTQAFNASVLRGEEFNAVMEVAPELMKRIAAGLGISTGELRNFATAGRLTAAAISQALLSQADEIDRAYGQIVPTIDQAASKLYNASVLFVGQLDQQTGASQKAVATLQLLGQNLDLVAALLGAGIAASVARGTQSLYGLVAASVAARAAARDQAIATAQQQAAAVAAAEGHVAAAQAAYNRALAEQRLAQQIVVALQAELGYGVTEQNLAQARLRSTAAAQAATAATLRYATAQAELNALQAAGAATSAGLFSRVLGVLAGPGGLILSAVAAFGLLYAAFSRQKEPTDALAKSTEQYADALKKSTAAQLDASRLDLEGQMRGQRREVDALSESVQQQVRWLEQVRQANGNVASATDELSRRQAALDAANQRGVALQDRLNQILDERKARQAALADGDAKEIAALQEKVIALEKLADLQEDDRKANQQLDKTEQQRIESLLAQAKARKDLAETERQSIALAQQRATAADETARIAAAEAIAARLKARTLEEIKASQQQLTPVEEKNLLTAQRAAMAKEAEASAARAAASALQTEADKLAETARLSPVLGTALDRLGVEQKLLATRITESGQDIIAAFRHITQNAQATTPQIATAFQAAINGSKTRAEARSIIDIYRQWAATAQGAVPKVSALLDGTNARLQAHNQILLTSMDYEARIAAVRAKGLTDAQRDAQIASDAQTLIARATLARLELSDDATAAEKRANAELRQGLLQRADALASQVQNESEAISLLGRLRDENVKLLQETADRADIAATISADDDPARKTLGAFVADANKMQITIPVRLVPQGGANGSSLGGLLDELRRNASSK